MSDCRFNDPHPTLAARITACTCPPIGLAADATRAAARDADRVARDETKEQVA